MDCSTSGLPVHHQLPEFTQTHVHRVTDVIQPSHPLSSPSPPTLNLSQHHRLFKWVSSSHQVAKVLEFLSASTSVLPMNTQDWSPLGWTGCISLQSMGLSRVFFNTTVQKHQFFGAQLSLKSNSQHLNMTTGKTIALTRQTFVDKVMSLLFNMLSRLVVTFLPRSKIVASGPIISWEMDGETVETVSDFLLGGSKITADSSSVFSKSSLNIWKFTVCVLLKPGLENFEHYFTSMWDEGNYAVVWAFFGIAFLRDWNENWSFPAQWLLLNFPNLLAYWVQHFHSIIFQHLK